MRFIIYQLTTFTFAIALSLPVYCQPPKTSKVKANTGKISIEKSASEKITTLDVNMGSANINFNPVNNNKMTTHLRNFGPNPAPSLPQPFDLMPLATPPLTRPVTQGYGSPARSSGYFTITKVPEPDISNKKEADALWRKTGWNDWHTDRAFRKEAIETISDDKPMDSKDVQDFLQNYYSYLKESGLSSASPPAVPNTSKPAKTISLAPKKEPELLANQQKLLVDNTQTTIKDPAKSSH